MGRLEKGQAVERRPVDQLQPPIVVFHQRGAALYPVAVVQIQHAVDLAHFRVMDVAAYDAVETAPAGFVRQRGLETVDGFDGAFHLPLQPGR